MPELAAVAVDTPIGNDVDLLGAGEELLPAHGGGITAGTLGLTAGVESLGAVVAVVGDADHADRW